MEFRPPPTHFGTPQRLKTVAKQTRREVVVVLVSLKYHPARRDGALLMAIIILAYLIRNLATAFDVFLGGLTWDCEGRHVERLSKLWKLIE